MLPCPSKTRALPLVLKARFSSSLTTTGVPYILHFIYRPPHLNWMHRRWARQSHMQRLATRTHSSIQYTPHGMQDRHGITGAQNRCPADIADSGIRVLHFAWRAVHSASSVLANSQIDSKLCSHKLAIDFLGHDHVLCGLQRHSRVSSRNL